MMNTQYTLLATWSPVVGFLVTLILTKLMLASSVFSKIQDIPNSRSLHDRPIPRIGGLAIMLGVLSAWHLLASPVTRLLSIAVMILMVLSFLDDLKDLSAKWRLLGHLLVAIGFVNFGLGPISVYLAVFFVIAVVWMTNLYNFMDGANGLAGGMAALGFSCYALVAAIAGDLNFALINLVIVGSSIAFLYFNFGQAKVFMGDAGSIPLGFLSAAIGLLGWQKGLWPMWFPVVIFSSFILDATVTLIKRLFRGERIWDAHREHYYQRLIRMGMSHQKMALIEYGLMLISGAVAMGALHQRLPYMIGLLSMCLFLKLFMMYRVDKIWQQYVK